MACRDILRAPLTGAFLSQPGIIAIIGGGGKTSLLHAMLRLLRGHGVHAVGAVTTKTYIQDKHPKRLIYAASLSACIDAVADARQYPEATVLCGGVDPQAPAKASGISPAWLDIAAANFPQAVIVVEADGSAGKSLKGHLSHEPVLPDTSRLVIPVIGADVLGQSINTATVHRPERFCELAGARPGEIITGEMIAGVVFHPQGYLHNTPTHTQVIPFINKVDSCRDHKRAACLLEALRRRGEGRITEAAVGSIEKCCVTVRKLEN
ncbi:MAG: selenium cofactor biosynthesis protein YqeC [Negativicutes bacterium]|nr:selenium cofactor biosynthesis protein YqeC [Negativicutes bacterium]